jgi:hypothetical protein
VRPDGTEMLECLSPTYDTASQEFLDQFRGLQADTDADRRRVTTEIEELFREITYKGSLRNPHQDDGRFDVELWRDCLHWRDIEVTFDRTGVLQSVTLSDPAEKRE